MEERIVANTGTTIGGAGGQHSMLGWFRNSKVRPPKPGTPVYFGERPEGRPFGNDLGHRGVLANHTVGFGRSNPRAG